MIGLKTESQFKDILFIIISLIYFPGLILAQTQLSGTDNLAMKFDGKYGQVEVGGNYVGAEFHHSLPLPSRISFYYPVANSIDLSTDYWKRGESHPFSIVVNVDKRTDTVGVEPCVYSWTPYQAIFFEDKETYTVNYSYQFCDDLPLMVVRVKFTNRSTEKKKFNVNVKLSTVVRTCQTYAFKDTAEFRYADAGKMYVADFKYRDTDSTSVFVVNAGDVPTKVKGNDDLKIMANPRASFSYSKLLIPSGKLEIVLLVGSCKTDEERRMRAKASDYWYKSVAKNEDRIQRYVYHDTRISMPDKNLEQTAYWSKATLATDRHYINGSIVPMPCPAEYNFFFTHDVLLTDLGAVFYDVRRVKHDLLYIKSLTRVDSVLPHAYYWRDDGFKTEFASADNWNHLWFMILCGTYLKHSGDNRTLAEIYPVLRKSVDMTLSNIGPNNLVYSTRPDWWDIGDNYGARSYLTALMVRALREYSFVAESLHKDAAFALHCLNISDSLKVDLVDRLWDNRTGYLLDTYDTNSVDMHYYAGPLVAVDYDLLDEKKAETLMQTARRELVDPNLGVRTAMPPDFDKLTSLYKFKEGEVGAPFVYINGAVWPQTTAWYILGLIELGHADSALESLLKYFTLSGIEHSPHGQPSFYEYRFSDPNSPDYGKIDKPNFLWAGGWYLNCLYHLMGIHENEWNISFSPSVPVKFTGVQYDLAYKGQLAGITLSGSGKFFKQIIVDGKSCQSAILTGDIRKVNLELGVPSAPYVAGASCIVNQVRAAGHSKILNILVEGVVGQKSKIIVVSPTPIRKVMLGGTDRGTQVISESRDSAYQVTLPFTFDKQVESAYFEF